MYSTSVVCNCEVADKVRWVHGARKRLFSLLISLRDFGKPGLDKVEGSKRNWTWGEILSSTMEDSNCKECSVNQGSAIYSLC
jgi:hypothetical protein